MKKLAIGDLMGLSAYDRVRDRFRQEIIELKKDRRLAVGDRVSLVFENRKTVLFQIQETLRAERITDLDKIKEEVDVYNTMIPDRDELSATLLIEIEDQAKIREDLLQFTGIDEAVYLEIGERFRNRALFEPGRSKEDKLSAVQYVRFRLNPDEKDAFLKGESEVAVAIDHPRYRARARIGKAMRRSLCEDLTAE